MATAWRACKLLAFHGNLPGVDRVLLRDVGSQREAFELTDTLSQLVALGLQRLRGNAVIWTITVNSYSVESSQRLRHRGD